MRPSLLAALVIASGTALSSTAQAQRWVTLDAGAGSSTHQFAPRGLALSLAPRLLWLPRDGRLDLRGLYSRGTSLGWNAELGGSGGVMFRHRPFTLDLGAEANMTRHRLGPGTSEVAFNPSVRFEAPNTRLTLAFGMGRATRSIGRLGSLPGSSVDTGTATPRDTSEVRTFVRASMGGTTRLGPLDLEAQVTRTQFGQRALRAGALWVPNDPRQDTLFRRYVTRYDDVLLGAGWANHRLRVDAAVEQRLGLEEFRARGWHVELTAGVSPELALFGSTGRTLSRLTVDLPARGYATAGLRWTVGPARKATARPDRPASAGMLTLSRDGETVAFRLRADRARVVEITGDFSEWEPLPLVSEGEGWWILTRRLPPGLYRVNIRYDGGPWLVPPGVPVEQDEFGGKSGLLMIP